MPFLRLSLRSLLTTGLHRVGASGMMPLEGPTASSNAFVCVEGLGRAVRLDGHVVVLKSAPIAALRPPATRWRIACPDCGRNCTLLYRLEETEDGKPWRCRVCAQLRRHRPPRSIVALLQAERALLRLRALPSERQRYEHSAAYRGRMEAESVALAALTAAAAVLAASFRWSEGR